MEGLGWGCQVISTLSGTWPRLVASAVCELLCANIGFSDNPEVRIAGATGRRC